MIYLQRIALILTIIGALNWGLVGIAGLDLVALLFPKKRHLSNRQSRFFINKGGVAAWPPPKKSA